MAQKIREAEGVLRAIPKPGETMYERVPNLFIYGTSQAIRHPAASPSQERRIF